jgi:hypothetical protein
MTLGEWAENSVERFGRDGAAMGIYGAVQELYEGGLGKIGEHVYNYGTPVWEKSAGNTTFSRDTTRNRIESTPSDRARRNGYARHSTPTSTARNWGRRPT